MPAAQWAPCCTGVARRPHVVPCDESPHTTRWMGLGVDGGALTAGGLWQILQKGQENCENRLTDRPLCSSALALAFSVRQTCACFDERREHVGAGSQLVSGLFLADPKRQRPSPSSLSAPCASGPGFLGWSEES